MGGAAVADGRSFLLELGEKERPPPALCYGPLKLVEWHLDIARLPLSRSTAQRALGNWATTGHEAGRLVIAVYRRPIVGLFNVTPDSSD